MVGRSPLPQEGRRALLYGGGESFRQRGGATEVPSSPCPRRHRGYVVPVGVEVYFFLPRGLHTA